MNKAMLRDAASLLDKIKRDPALHTQALVSAIFIVLVTVFVWSLDRYWQHSLQPRLYSVAETQAKILAESQSTILVETLERTAPKHLRASLLDAARKMLIVEDPAIGERFIRHLALQIDYSTVNAAAGSLDISEGGPGCLNCFNTDVLLTGRNGEILGLAGFTISDGYFRTLSQDMKSKLFAESSIVLVLVVAGWIVMTIMFHRLHAAKKIVEASDQAKTRFMANVTHELRTPLNAILGYTQLYRQDTALMQQHGQGIKTIDRSADHLLLMINDILEFSRANEESLTLHPGEVHLAKFLNTLVEMMRVRAQLKGLEFIYRFSDQLPSIIVADEKRLRQILLNLLSNAVKFTESGQVVFSVEKVSSRYTHNARLRFNVRDTGIGIDRDHLKSIFIPFHQLDNAITRAEGTGLGLTISQRLINLMDSKLQVSSEIGQGSEFAFILEVPVIGKDTIGPQIDNPTTPLTLPDEQWVTRLKEQVRRHNILGIRELVEQLQASGRHTAFLQYIQPFIRQYRFKQLLDWLEQQE